jgi:hypothetical protein
LVLAARLLLKAGIPLKPVALQLPVDWVLRRVSLGLANLLGNTTLSF